MTVGAVNFGNLYLSTRDAVSKYGLTESAVKKLDADQNGKISAGEIANLSSEANSAVVNYFNQRTKGQFGQAIGFAGSKNAQPVFQTNPVNPVKPNSLQNAFASNHNERELSPVVTDGVRGVAMPRVYA